jgi:glyceraldehyde 3-phosphate dehydrogenase
MKIFINGLGRIGKLVFRRLCDEGLYKKIHSVNEKEGIPSDQEYFLKYDSVHGSWGEKLNFKNNNLFYKEHPIRVSNFNHIEDLSFPEATPNIAIDCTGKFKDEKSLQAYFDKGIDYVLVSAPIDSKNVFNIVYGINHNDVNLEKYKILTAASCTTNCLAPIVKVLETNIGISHGSITTIHNITNTQTIADSPNSNLRRSRSGINSLIPTTTGSAKAISLIYPELKGRLNGHAVRVPLLNSSLTDCVFEMKKKTDKENINQLFRDASKTYLKNIISYEDKPLVSTDYVNNPNSSIIDCLSTMVVNDTQLKVYAWYDNEWGYACRMVDIVSFLTNKLG